MADLRLNPEGRVFLDGRWVAMLTVSQEPDGRSCLTLAETAFLDGDGDYVHKGGIHTRLGITSHWPESAYDAAQPPEPVRPTITPELVERFAAYYEAPGNGAWGSLHIILDDGNVEDHNADFCVKHAAETGDGEGFELARILRSMSRSQRGRIGRRAEALVRERRTR